MTLKNSARNCTLKPSEIFLIDRFLNTEKSKFVVPGPVKRLRPAFPRRLKQSRGLALNWGAVGSLGCAFGGDGSQLFNQKLLSGAAGTVKHSVLTYLLGFPGLVRVAQPGVDKTFGNAQSSALLSPCGSPPVPQVAVKGTPSLTLKIVPNSHPFATHAAGPDRDLGEGTCQVKLNTKVRLISKSERARSNFRL